MKLISRFAAALAASLAVLAPAHAGTMPINLYLFVPGDKAQDAEFRGRLQAIPYFAGAKENWGSSLALFVSVSQVPTTGGAAASATSGLLAASTLGIIPVANNQDVSIHYEVRVNTIKVASFDFAQNFTSVSNLWSGGATKLPDDARVWLLSTVDQFAAAAAADKDLAALQAEYEGYFSK